MGEKGIGRLAIASIGSPGFNRIESKIKDPKEYDIVVAFINLGDIRVAGD